MEGISGYAGPIITLKPAFAKSVLLIPAVRGCSAPEAKAGNKGKKKVASVNPANSSGNSGLKGIISVERMKNRSSQKSPVFL